MKYLKRENVGGYADDQAFEGAYGAYEAYLSSISSALTKGIRSLAHGIDFHDGRIISIDLSQMKAARILYLIGNLQSGYQKLVVTYKGFEADASNRRAMELVAVDRRSEIIASEVVSVEPQTWRHSLLFLPDHEFSIEFKDVDIEAVQIDARHMDYFGEPFIE